jgi:hypothetical protein
MPLLNSVLESRCSCDSSDETGPCRPKITRNILARTGLLATFTSVRHPPRTPSRHTDANDNDFSRLAGYSVEKYCQRFVDPPEQRLHRAYILAKYVHILDSDEFAWDSPNKTLFADLSEKYNISFVAGADHQGDVSIQKGITNMGRMPEDEFYKELALGRLVVGVGMPMISPTPYDALCREYEVDVEGLQVMADVDSAGPAVGVPFLNPLWRWDEKNPEDSSAWCCEFGQP